jgi:hypothetical protein
MEDLSCRYCKESVVLPDEIENVISPCRCRGSLELVHIECLNKWGKSRCEICKFKYYANTPSLQAIPLYIPPIEDLRNEEPIRNPRDEVVHILELIEINVPLFRPNGFRSASFFYNMSNLLVLYMYPENASILSIIYKSTYVYLWFINESYRIYDYRRNMICAMLLCITYSILGLILSPFYYLYYYVKNISNRRVLNHLVVLLCFQEIWNWYNNYTIYNYSLLGTINNILY